MKFKITYITTVIIYFLAASTSGQNKISDVTLSNIQNLNIGDQLPNFEFKIINSYKERARTEDFKNQLLLIDFWSIGCPGCIEALPRMDSLQKQFGNKIKILPITNERKNLVTDFWKHNKFTKNLNLSGVIEDVLFSAYFKHRTIPHEIWIYKGKIIAITGIDFVDANNIGKILNGEKVDWPVKNDFYVFDGLKDPLFKPDTTQVDPKSIIKYAAISDYKDGVNSETFSGGSGIVRDSIRRTVRAFFLNQPIYTSYFILNLFGGNLLKPSSLIKPAPQNSIGPNEIVWEVADKSKYTYISKSISGYEQNYVKKNAICFESLNPDTGQTDAQVYKSIYDDLNRLLRLNVRWERRKEKVLILARTGPDDKIKSKMKIVQTWTNHANGVNPHISINGSFHKFRDVSLNYILNELNSQEANPYVFDETGYKDHIDMDLNFSSWTDISAIRRGLSSYGLDLKEEEQEVDKFVFSEVNGGGLVDGEMAAAAKAKKSAQKNMANPELTANKTFLGINKNKPGIITLSSGLQYKVIKTGIGLKPSLNDKVSVHFTGTLVNGKIFDSSYQTGRPFTTRLTDVIAGWKEALQLMPSGSKWIIYIPAELAYGAHTNQGAIPPNSTLIFEIELIQVLR